MEISKIMLYGDELTLKDSIARGETPSASLMSIRNVNPLSAQQTDPEDDLIIEEETDENGE